MEDHNDKPMPMPMPQHTPETAAATPESPDDTTASTIRIPVQLSPRIVASHMDQHLPQSMIGGAGTAPAREQDYATPPATPPAAEPRPVYPVPIINPGEINLLTLYTLTNQLVIENREQHYRVDTSIGELRSDLRERDARITKRQDTTDANVQQLDHDLKEMRSEMDVRKGKFAVYWLIGTTAFAGLMSYIWPPVGRFLHRLFAGGQGSSH